MLGIDWLSGHDPYRIECLIYGRLCTICLIGLFFRPAVWYARELNLGEVSAEKLTKWFYRAAGGLAMPSPPPACGNRLRLVTCPEAVELLFSALFDGALKQLLKQKRKRKTTLNLIEDQHPFERQVSDPSRRGV